jgi:hypothetical protein
VNIVVPRRIALSYTNQKWLKTSAGTGLGGTFTFFPPFAAVAVDTTSTPTNDTQLQTYADKFTLDLCQWLSAELVDIRYAGIVSIDPDPSYGNITWTYRQDQLSTRVQPTNYPWRPFPFPVTAGNFTWSGRVVQIASNTVTTNTNVTVVDTLGGTLTDITPTANISVHGITDSSIPNTTPFVGQLAEIRNLSDSYNINLVSNSGSAGTGEKMMFPDDTTEVVPPRTTATLKYTPSNTWNLLSLFCCRSNNTVINWTNATITLTNSTFTVLNGTADLGNTNTLILPTVSKITLPGTKGDLPYESATNTLSMLPIGSNNQILTVASGLPSWQDPSSLTGITGAASSGGQVTQTITSTPVDVFDISAPTSVQGGVTFYVVSGSTVNYVYTAYSIDGSSTTLASGSTAAGGNLVFHSADGITATGGGSGTGGLQNRVKFNLSTSSGTASVKLSWAFTKI